MTIVLILLLSQTWGLQGAAWANCGYWANAIILAGTARGVSQRSRGGYPAFRRDPGMRAMNRYQGDEARSRPWRGRRR